jgi:hypothetical protein
MQIITFAFAWDETYVYRQQDTRGTFRQNEQALKSELDDLTNWY